MAKWTTATPPPFPWGEFLPGVGLLVAAAAGIIWLAKQTTKDPAPYAPQPRPTGTDDEDPPRPTWPEEEDDDDRWENTYRCSKCGEMGTCRDDECVIHDI